MAAQGFSLAARISRWELLERRLAQLLGEMPHLASAHAELQQMIAEAKALELVFEQRRADWLDASKRRKTLFQSGDELRSRLGAALQFQHGFKSEKLAEYGLRPRRDRSPGKKQSPPEPPPTPAQPTPAVAAAGGAPRQT